MLTTHTFDQDPAPCFLGTPFRYGAFAAVFANTHAGKK
jgi:hypothetical protein